MPTDYANATYWTDRLRTEGAGPGFDWLLAGDDAGFKSFIQSTLDQVSSSHSSSPPSFSPSVAVTTTTATASPATDPPSSPLRILHIGPGSSTLSLWLRDLVEDPRDVVHVDFAESAKELGERWERERWPDKGGAGGRDVIHNGTHDGEEAGPGSVGKTDNRSETSPLSTSPVRRMRWLTADMTRWADVEQLPVKVAQADISENRWQQLPTIDTDGTNGNGDTPTSTGTHTDLHPHNHPSHNISSPPPKFSLLIDKGTLDAITCGSDLSAAESASGPDTDGLAQRILALYPALEPRLLRTPVYASLKVALNLAAITRAGGAWVMLSYSGTRFDLFMRKWPAAEQQQQQQQATGTGQEQLKGKEGRGGERPRSLEELASRLWHLEVRRELVAEQRGAEVEEGGTVRGPVVFHWLYLLRRTGVPFG